MNQLAHLNYNFEELEILKILAKFSNDFDKAEDLIFSGLDEYELTRIKKIIEKFYHDGIWDFEETEDGKDCSTFKIDLQDFILNCPNPIPENLRSGIDTNAIIEKVSCSNLNLFEINYITTLLKKDAVSQF
jgi:PleD family two-component response regulator